MDWFMISSDETEELNIYLGCRRLGGLGGLGWCGLAEVVKFLEMYQNLSFLLNLF